MAPENGPVRWNPQSQQWEHRADPRRRSRRGSPDPGAGDGAQREPGRPDLPPKPAYPPGDRPLDPWRAPDGPEPRGAPP
ncbi:hypothetical protein ACFXOJ_40715, partial [Streptomyces vinaceus]